MPRRRRPTHDLVLAGTREDRINRDAPIPSDGIAVVAPEYLFPEARAVFDKLAPGLVESGRLTHWDVPVFAVYCDLVTIHRETCGKFLAMGARNRTVVAPEHRINRDAADLIDRIGARFGLSPADRL